MAAHAKDALRGPSIAQVFNLSLAIPAPETCSAKGLVPSKDSQILDLVSAGATTVGTIVADEGAITKEEEVRIGVEEGTAGVTSEAIEMPSITGWDRVSLKLPRQSCLS